MIDHSPFGLDASDSVLFEGMNLNVPKIFVYRGLLVAEDIGTMWGQYEPTTHLRCWRPDDAFVEVDCPASLLPYTRNTF